MDKTAADHSCGLFEICLNKAR